VSFLRTQRRTIALEVDINGSYPQILLFNVNQADKISFSDNFKIQVISVEFIAMPHVW